MRLFLALGLPPAILEELGRCRRVLERRCAGWRWSKRDGLHLTMRFLGDVADEDLGPLRAMARETAHRATPCSLALDGYGTFPPRGRPRVLWAGVRDRERDRLRALAGSLERGCRNLGFDADHRSHRAHVTLARARRELRVDRPPADAGPDALEFLVDVLTLFESRLTPSGATYRIVERFPLDGV